MTHGTASSYSNHHCRCVSCTTAWAAYVRKRRVGRKQYRSMMRCAYCSAMVRKGVTRCFACRVAGKGGAFKASPVTGPKLLPLDTLFRWQQERIAQRCQDALERVWQARAQVWTRTQLFHDTEIEVRGTTGAMGGRCGAAQ